MSTKPTREGEYVIFLDFDGVLHPMLNGVELFAQLPRLQQIVRLRPHVKVVIHSSWRTIAYYSDADFADMMDLGDQFLGTTPREVLSRWESIKEWMSRNGVPKKWVILDDMAYSFPTEAKPNLIAPFAYISMRPDDWEELERRLDAPYHRWSLSWPGNHCLDCGQDGFEGQDDALINCPDCQCGCDKCSGTGMVPNPNQKVTPCMAV